MMGDTEGVPVGAVVGRDDGDMVVTDGVAVLGAAVRGDEEDGNAVDGALVGGREVGTLGGRFRRVGFTVGRCANLDGLCDGVAFGALLFGGSCVGDKVGNVTGLCVGNGVVGFFVGRTFFFRVGLAVTRATAGKVGRWLGLEVADRDGLAVGVTVGTKVGSSVGNDVVGGGDGGGVGFAVGSRVGLDVVGAMVGDGVAKL